MLQRCGRAGLLHPHRRLCAECSQGRSKIRSRHVEEPVPVHLAQAKCYAALLAERDSLSEAGVRMIYVNLDTERTKTFDYSYTASELKTWYEGLMAEYHKWAKFLADHRKERDESMSDCGPCKAANVKII